MPEKTATMESPGISSVLGFGFIHTLCSLYSSTYFVLIVHPRVDDFVWLTKTLSRGLEPPTNSRWLIHSIFSSLSPCKANIFIYRYIHIIYIFHEFYTYLIVIVTPFYRLKFDLIGPPTNQTSGQKNVDLAPVLNISQLASQLFGDAEEEAVSMGFLWWFHGV